MAGPNSNRRILAELKRLEDLRNGSDLKFLLDKSPADEPGPSIILGRILPSSDIYNQKAFQIEIKLPAEYPFKAPDVHFITPIYHPNVDERGNISIDILQSSETFRPTNTLAEVVRALINLIDHPDFDHVLRPEVAHEYVNNRAEFNRKATEMVRQHGLPRE